MYLDNTKVGKVEGAAEKVIQTQALRRDFPLGGFGSQGSKGALTPSRKPPSQQKVGRVLVGRRREEGKGQATASDRWLAAGQDRQDPNPEPDPGGRQGSFEQEGKRKERKLEGSSPEKLREGNACPRGEGTLSQKEENEK